MPIHDWSRVPAGLFHDFHQSWSVHIARALNRGGLPSGLSAMIERRTDPPAGDAAGIRGSARRNDDRAWAGGPLTLDPPTATVVRRTDRLSYADRGNRIAVKHHLVRTVAVIELMSPGTKDGRRTLRDFVADSLEFMRRGVHPLVVDLFPPTPRDPFGIHKAIWDEFIEEPFAFPPGKDRILASYEMGPERAAYVEPVGVGDTLPAMPLFVAGGVHVRVPLESTYNAAWAETPEEMRTAVETGVMPEPDAGD